MATKADTAPPSSKDDEAVDSPTTDEERIDESLAESFPASDPPAVHPIKRD